MSLKAHVCEVQTIFSHVDHPEYDAPVTEEFILYTDLCPLESSNDGISQRAVYLKQLGSIGVQSWIEDIDIARRMQVTFTEHDACDECPPYFHLRAFVFGADQGPDQKKCARLLQNDVADLLFILITHQWCTFHVLALIATHI